MYFGPTAHPMPGCVAPAPGSGHHVVLRENTTRRQAMNGRAQGPALSWLLLKAVKCRLFKEIYYFERLN